MQIEKLEVSNQSYVIYCFCEKINNLYCYKIDSNFISQSIFSNISQLIFLPNLRNIKYHQKWPSPYEENSITLEKGDIFVFTIDSIVD